MSDKISRADAIARLDAVAQAAAEANLPDRRDGLRDAIVAIRALPAVEVGVRELNWADFDDRGAKAQAWNSANYLIQKWSDGRYEISASYPGYSTSIEGIDRFYPTIEAAKAAAQADYAARIRSALTVTPAQDVAGRAKFYIDCEFDGHDGPLLSLAMVREDGFSLHLKTDAKAKNPWVVENVMPIIDDHRASISGLSPVDEVGEIIKAFIGANENPTIIADSPVDIGRFCRAISTGKDGGWSPTDYPGMTFVVYNVDCFPTALEGAVQHNAWWDAMALRAALARMKEAGE